MLSIEITRERPLHCPACYAYTNSYLGGQVTLRELSDLRGDQLVNGVINLVKKHGALQVSLAVGSIVNKVAARSSEGIRWKARRHLGPNGLVQLQ